MDRHDNTGFFSDRNDLFEKREKIGSVALIAKLGESFDLGTDTIAIVAPHTAR